MLILPIEAGRARSRVSLDQRTEEVQRLIPLPWRLWNPHMRGVGIALRLAFGVDLERTTASLVDHPQQSTSSTPTAGAICCAAAL